MTWGKWYWTVMLIVASAMFLFPEAYALFTNHANTLSDYARYELGAGTAVHFNAHTIAWYLTLIAWLFVTTWLTYHIWFEVMG